MRNQESQLKLMIPGPVQPQDEVLEAMGGPVRPHYGPEWTVIYKETLELMKTIFDTNGDVFLLVGSGTAGIDACIGSALATGEKILVGSNGFFGDRLALIAESYGLEVVLISAPEGEPLSAQAFRQAFEAHGDARALAAVHLETATTVVNPIEEIGSLSREAGAIFIVDAVSSLAGLPLHMDAWGIDLCVSASQKCLGAPPGLAPVAVGPRGWEAIDRTSSSSHGWYLNLRTWRQYAEDWGDWHPSPVSMATNNVMALRASLKDLLAEGLEKRLLRYRSLALRLRDGLRSIGMHPFTSDESLAPVLTAAWSPEGVPSGEIVDYMDQVHRIKISPGLGEQLGQKIIRIGHMAPTTTETDIDQVVEALDGFTPGWRSSIG